MIDKFRGYDLNIIYGGKVDRSKYVALGKLLDIGVNFYQNISDQEKFDIISESKFMIFLSQFEGFGYPLVESMCCDTPVFCNELDVFREIHGSKVFYIDSSIKEYNFFSQLTNYKSYKEYYNKEFSIQAYGKKLNLLLENFNKRNQKTFKHYYIFLFKFFLSANLKSILLYLKSVVWKTIDVILNKKIPK